jgi:predicted P-loop ATPase
MAFNLFPDDYELPTHHEAPHTANAGGSSNKVSTPVRGVTSPQQHNNAMSDTQRFLDALGKTGAVKWRVIPDTKQMLDDGHKVKTLTGTLQQAHAELQKYNSKGYGIFVTVNDGGTKAEEITRIPALRTDYDTKGGTPTPQYTVEPSFYVRTSEGNHHAYWLTDDITPSDFAAKQRALAEHYGTDLKVCDLPHVMRVPGFYHMKRTPQLVTMSGNFKRYTGAELDRLLVGGSKPALDVEVPDTLPIQHRSEAMQAFYRQLLGLKDGDVNNGLFKVAALMGESNEAREVCEAVARTALEERGTQWTERESDTFNNGFNKGSVTKRGKEVGTNAAKEEAIRKVYKGRIRLNEMGNVIELDGHEMRVERAYLSLGKTLGVNIDKVFAMDVLAEIAFENKYHPVRERLLQWRDEYGEQGKELLDYFASRFMGCHDPIEIRQMRKFLLAMTARILYPGCQSDSMLVLAGGQGKHKTKLLRALGLGHYIEFAASAQDRDAIQSAHAGIIVNMDEIGHTFRKRELDSLKAFITSPVDVARLAYERSLSKLKRSFSLTATTNDAQFLIDVTGNRRFWVMTITEEILYEEAKAALPQVLAAAVCELERALEGYDPLNTPKELALWWNNDDEAEALTERNKQFELSDPIEDVFIKAADTLQNLFTMTELFDEVRASSEQFSQLSAKNNIEATRAKRILEAHGYTYKKARRHNETPKSMFVRAETTDIAEQPPQQIEPQARKYRVGDTVYDIGENGYECKIVADAATDCFSGEPVYTVQHAAKSHPVNVKESRLAKNKAEAML